MKLTKEDKQILKEYGFPEEDFTQIEEAIKKTTYELITNLETKEVSQDEALKILGRKQFLSGIGRSAFHFSAVRENKGGKIYFNSSKLFN